MFNPTFYPLQENNGITLVGDLVKLKSLLILERSLTQSSEYTFIFPPSAGSTGQALFWSGSETTFRGIAIADVATLQTSLNSINSTLNSLGTAAFQATSYFALSGHVHSDATILMSGFMSGGDKAKVNALGTASTKNTGTTTDTIPLIGAGDKLPSALIPDINFTNNAAFTINADATNTGSDRSITLTTSNQTSSYTLAFPPFPSGTTNQFLTISSIAGSIINLGWATNRTGFAKVIAYNAASISINLVQGSMVTIALNQDTTITSITGMLTGSPGVEFTIFCTQNSTGGYTLSFPSGTIVTGAISSAPNSTSIIKVFSFDSGTNWEAVVLKPIQNVGTIYWTPAQIATAAWYDASSSSSISFGSGISQWNDKSGNSRNLVQATASSQPALVSNGLNSKNTISFDGTNDFLRWGSSSNLGNNITFIFVAKYNNTNRIGLFDSAPNLPDMMRNYPSDRLDWHSNPDLIMNAPSGSFAIYVFTYSLVGTRKIEQWIDGANYASATSGSSTSANWGNFTIGGVNGSDFPFPGEVAESLIISSAISTNIREKIEGYLAHKWINNLPSGHIYKNSAPTV